MAAERMAAEQNVTKRIVEEEKPITWKLSEREITIVKSLGKGGADQ